MECCGRPNRSDIHLSSEEEAKIESKTREYFNGVAPKRHSKPQRSDYASQYVDVLSNDEKQEANPELVEFQRLENDSQVCCSSWPFLFSMYICSKINKSNFKESNPELVEIQRFENDSQLGCSS